jgi:predicted nucleotide-binding protein
MYDGTKRIWSLTVMAPRRPAPPPERPNLTIEQKRNRIGRLERCISELEGFDPQTVQKRFAVPEVMALEASIKAALAAAFGDDTPDYRRYQRATSLDHGSVQMRSDPMFGGGYVDYDARDREEGRRYLAEGKAEAIPLLRQAIQTLEDEIADESPAAPSVPTLPKNKVFVVHGHDDGAKHAVARFLEKLVLGAILLSEKPDQGRTIIEKFEAYATEVGFAVVLLTPDDVGHVKTASDEQERARQNVIFELGYFVGRLGRGRACLLRKGNVEIPSDLAGVIYTELDANNGWQQKLVMEMKAAKMHFDANRLWE